MSAQTLLWHDYETSGTRPRVDRPLQFAALRTDPDLHPVEDPQVLYCRPAEDVLPVPEACLVTGITPQAALEKGLPEGEFFARIQAAMARPRTCTVGYNSLRFDDEFTRFGLYRNLFDPYAREWQHGNSRWDLIDVVRLAWALRPEGLEWPLREDGAPSFRLEELTAANAIAHGQAHDALADVEATIGLARALRRVQPRLYRYVFEHRTRQAAARLLNVHAMQPVLHVSGRYPARQGCIALVAPVAAHPFNRNSIVVFDLRHDPAPLAGMDPEALRRRVFTASADLEEGEERIPLKEVHLNRAPVLAPPSTLTPERAAALEIDLEAARRHVEQLRAMDGLGARIQAIYREGGPEPAPDPEQALYDGFVPDEDRARMVEFRNADAGALRGLQERFRDPRLRELAFRYRARNFPETLDADEVLRWREHVARRLREGAPGGGLGLAAYRRRIAELRASAGGPEQQRLLADLERWGDALAARFGVDDPGDDPAGGAATAAAGEP